MSENEKSSIHFGLSSRLKKIYIELHDYFFFHGPSEIRKIDNRFIGRHRIINKLKAILTNNDTRSGAYLITGYRGMGKSSFVSKVIDEIDPSKRISALSPRYVRILASIFLLSLFKLNPESLLSVTLYIFMPLVAMIVSLIYLLFSDRQKDQLKISNTKNPKITSGMTFKSRLLKMFILSDKEDSERLLRRQIQVVYLTFLIHLVVVTITSISYNSMGYISRLIIYVLLYLIIGIINYIYNVKRENIISKKKNLFDVFTFTYKKIRNYFNYSRRIYIRINLGYDDLKEIDILRLISRNIEKQFRNYKQFSFQHFLTSFLKFIFIFFFVGIIYYYNPIYQLNKQIKDKSGLLEYLPSQQKSILETESNEVSELSENIKEKHILKDIVIYCDSIVYIIYRKFRENIQQSFPTLILRDYISIKEISPHFQFLPKNIDYFFILYFLLFFLGVKYWVPKLFGVASDHEILKQLKKLNESIEVQLSEERGGNSGIQSAFIFNLFKKKTKNQPRADIREIEKRLIEILEMFDRYNRFSIKPEFICIFDELDKIEPHENVNIIEKEEETKSFDQMETTFFATQGVRRRQQTIFKILSNLKHFLNTAKAKFIFIAGRELYDAALADVSDRNFFIGSIFHDVIYVHSFLTDSSDSKASDISSMTETYICQYLFPNFYDVKEYSLKEYKNYLEIYFENSCECCNWSVELKKQKIEKIIFTLRCFITYLTYRSNGAPKKITAYFENYVFKPNTESRKPDEHLTSDSSLCIGFNPRNHYLELGYYDQYTFGMLSYLVNPVILAVSKSIKDFGDKLLVSTSFLVDHLYKFHKNAFSWRNIELTPEILDINKAPQLRELISLIIKNLSNSHLLEILSGLYDFKFRKKISEEISFLSKISEREAAAFNFTLDESLSIKKHHRELLKEIKANYTEDPSNPDFINSISFIHMIIGDLFFYDEEYNEAIIEYMEAVQHLRKQNFNAKNASYFMLLIRNMLKLGYALEKRKSHISAFMIYSQLISYTVKFREIDLSLLGLEEKRLRLDLAREFIEKKEQEATNENEKSEKEEKNFIIKPNTERWQFREDDSYVHFLVRSNGFTDKNEIKLHTGGITGTTKLSLNFEKEIQFENLVDDDHAVCLSDDFVELVNNTPFTSLKEDTVFNISAFEGIRIIYQPLIAKIQMIEKAHLGGITPSDLIRVENEYIFITKTTKYREKRLLAAEFWCKIGDILFFKNGLIPKKLFVTKNQSEMVDSENEQSCRAIENYYCCPSKESGINSKNKALCAHSLDAKKIVIDMGHNVPCQSCNYYMKSLKLMCIDHLQLDKKAYDEKNFLSSMYYYFKTKKMKSQNAMALRVIANIISGVSNSFYSCCTEDTMPQLGFLNRFLDFVENPERYFIIFFAISDKKIEENITIEHLEFIRKNPRKFNKIEEVFIYYFYAYLFYLCVGQHKEAADQMLRIIYLLKSLIRVDEGMKKNVTDKIIEIQDVLVIRSIKCLYRSYGNIHRQEIEDYKIIFNYTLEYENEVELKNISLIANLKEIIIAFEEIKLKCGKCDILESQENLVKCSPVTPYSTINRMFNRIIDLKFKVTINYKVFEKLGFLKMLENLGGEKVNEEEVGYRVKDQLSESIDMILLDTAFHTDTVADIEEKVFLAIEFLIIDSIFCLQEIIKLVGIYGITYMVNYSILASAHRRMADWSDYYFSYFRNSPIERKKRIQKDLGTLIGIDNLQFIGTRYHYEKAREAYYSILELHREGKAYHNMIGNMYYLNDDFDDPVYHFNAAAERYRINSGEIEKKLDKVKEELKNSSVFDYNRYLSNRKIIN